MSYPAVNQLYCIVYLLVATAQVVVIHVDTSKCLQLGYIYLKQDDIRNCVYTALRQRLSHLRQGAVSKSCNTSAVLYGHVCDCIILHKRDAANTWSASVRCIQPLFLLVL